MLTERALYVFHDEDRTRLLYRFPLCETQFGTREEAGDFFALSPTAPLGSAERDGVVFHCDSDEDARAWSRHIADTSVAMRDPLARFGLTQRESLLAALRAHEYVLPMALLYYAHKKEERASHAATTALLDVFESQGEALDFVRFVIDVELDRTNSERDLLRENNVNSRVLTRYAQRVGAAYLRATLAGPLKELAAENKDMECFAAKVSDPRVLAQNRSHVAHAMQRLLDAVMASREALPGALRAVAHYLWVAIKAKFPSGTRPSLSPRSALTLP